MLPPAVPSCGDASAMSSWIASWNWPLWRWHADQPLWTAVFDPDRTRALKAAAHWLNQTAEDRIAYRHHRLLGAVSRRFGADPGLARHRAMLRSVERQLWVRSIASVADLAETLGRFDQMNMPYFLHGNILWILDGTPLFRDLETLDVTVPEEAFGFALSQLWSRGWTPGPEVSVLFAPDPVDLVRKGFSRIRLRTDRVLLPPHADLSRQSLWDTVLAQNIFGYSLRFPAKAHWPLVSSVSGAGPTDALQARIDREQLRRLS